MGSTPFSEKIKTLREDAGLKVANVVERLGVARASVYAWEAGDHQPEPGTLLDLLDLYRPSDADQLVVWRLFGGATAQDAPAVEVAA